jgi:RNA polymerase sigma-70 factor (ECF subfamily)
MTTGGRASNEWIVSALERYERPLLRYAAWLLDDPDRAKDVVQETFLRLCKEKDKSVGDRLPQWLFTVCRNLVFDVRKRDSRVQNLDDVPHLDETDIAVALEALEQREILEEILRLVDELPKNQREVIYLRFKCGFSYKEISELTHLSSGNVGFLLHSAVDSIRKRVEKKPRTSDSARRKS